MKRVKEGAKWTWSALRPGAVIGFSLVRSCLPFSPPSHPPCTPRKHMTTRTQYLLRKAALSSERQINHWAAGFKSDSRAISNCLSFPLYPARHWLA